MEHHEGRLGSVVDVEFNTTVLRHLLHLPKVGVFAKRLLDSRPEAHGS
jgi:hypothetical protein